MAEYNPSKIIKDGNTYNFRDTTKIPLSGSNAISGGLIPATTDAYDLGSVSYQWNNAYIKSLTINGVACGDILTHNVSEFVNVSSNQTIAGVKTFSDGVVGNVSGTVNLTLRTKSGTARIFLRDNSAASFPNTVNLYSTVDGQEYGVFLNGNAFHPNSNDMNLGVSSRKWKTLNGINPGALSLPSDAYIDIDTTNYAWGSNFTFTPNYDGYCFLSIAAGNYYTRLISLKAGRGEYYFSNQNNIFRFTFPVYKGKLVTILTASSGTESVIPTIRVFSCQGNV